MSTRILTSLISQRFRSVSEKIPACAGMTNTVGIIASILSVFILSMVFSATTFAADAEVVSDDMSLEKVISEEVIDESVSDIKEVADLAEENCVFSAPTDKEYDADIISVRKKRKVEPSEVFEVKVFMRNTGNMPWFSNNSMCKGPHMALTTERTRNHESHFYSEDFKDSNWETNSTVGMDQLRVDPGEIASFTFSAQSPSNVDVIKEYFVPVLKNIKAMNDAEFSIEVLVGDSKQSLSDIRRKIIYSVTSGSVMNVNLYGEKVIVVDRSDQIMSIYLDGQPIRDFQVSTGASRTPTPLGETSIILKQEVRVGHKSPHYIMPKFMMFRAGGYGLHALPSLGTDGGVFWTEAREHIGIPVSHGCIRLLPEDADFLYEFAEIGTKVIVQQ